MADLNKAIQEGAAVERREKIDSINRYFVSASANRICILNPPLPHLGMSPDEAMTLAAWLVALAEYQAHFTFAEVLEKVQST